jgi:formamidopyrimidine-DNA glycosylase
MKEPLQRVWVERGVTCATCGRAIHERDLAYTRDRETFFCSVPCDHAHWNPPRPKGGL